LKVRTPWAYFPVLAFVVLALIPLVIVLLVNAVKNLLDWLRLRNPGDVIQLYTLWILLLTMVAVVWYLCETRRIADAEWAPRFAVSASPPLINNQSGCNIHNNTNITNCPTVVRLGWHSPYPIRGTIGMQYHGGQNIHALNQRFNFWAGFEGMNPRSYCLWCLSNNQIQAPQQRDRLEVGLEVGLIDLEADAALPILRHEIAYEFNGSKWVVI
jgi:hypothetical protein